MQMPIFIIHCERIRRRQAYYIRFLINDQLTTRIKELPEEHRKWNASMKVWELTTIGLFTLIKSYKKSKKLYFDFGNEDSRKIFIQQIRKIEVEEEEKRKFIAELNIKKEHWVKYKKELEETYVQYSEQCHALLKEGIKLFPHQIIAAMFMNATRNTLISHEMGTGKSLSSILYAEMNNFQKIFVITPNSLKFNYYGEIQKFTNSSAHIVNWNKNNCGIEDAKYVIVNYDFFNSGDIKKFKAKWNKLGIEMIDCLILDECQAIKNTKSNTYKNFNRTFTKKIFRDGKVSKIFLSGTPAPNRAYELYNVLNQISPLDFPTKKYFYQYYCGMVRDIENGWGYVTDSAESKLEELYHKIAPFTHRIRKFEVLKDLPDKTYQRIVLEMTEEEARIYEDIEKNVANEFIVHPTSNPLTIMLRLRQYVSLLKIKHVIELVENILETGEKVVIVDMFKESLYQLQEKFGSIAGLHTGDQTVEERAEIVQHFQDLNDNMKIFNGSIQTCKYGLTLTAASKLFMLTSPFVPGEYDQVADRCHRISQKNAVNIYVPVFPDTIDDYVFTSVENKRKEIVRVMDNEDYNSDVSESVLSEVIKIIKEKHGKPL